MTIMNKVTPKTVYLKTQVALFAFVCALFVSVAYPATSHAYALADGALLKFYGGIMEPEGHHENYDSVSGTVPTFMLTTGDEVMGFWSEYDQGLMYGIAIEYFFADHWSLELSWERHNSDIDDAAFAVTRGPDDIRVNLDEIAGIDDSGEIEHTLYGLNVYYNFGPVGKSKFYPYIGLGYIQSDESVLEVSNVTFENDGHDGTQYIAGFAVSLSQTWNIFFDYRNIDLDGVRMQDRIAGTIRSVDYRTELLLVGLSLEF